MPPPPGPEDDLDSDGTIEWPLLPIFDDDEPTLVVEDQQPVADGNGAAGSTGDRMVTSRGGQAGLAGGVPVSHARRLYGRAQRSPEYASSSLTSC